MKHSKYAKTLRPKWWKGPDRESVQEALDEAVVDAYDDYEQHAGLVASLADCLEFPFAGEVVGERVVVVGMVSPEDEELGLDLVCERGGKRYCLAAGSVELIKPLPEGHLLLAAYLDWRRRK